MAASIEELAARSVAVSGSTVTASPAVMMSAEPAAELDRQADRLNADWIVTTSTLSDATHDLLIVSGSVASIAEGVIELTSDDPAAWEVAARLARTWHRDMLITSGRGHRRLADTTRQLGIAVVDGSAGLDGSAEPAIAAIVTVDPVPAEADQLVIMVQAHEDRTRLGLRERLDRIGDHVPPQEEPA